MMVLIRFWRSLTKKDSVKSARYDTGITFFFYSNSSFGTFFSYTDPDPGPDFSGSDPDPKHRTFFCHLPQKGCKKSLYIS